MTLVLALSTLTVAGTTSAQSGKVEVLWLGQAAFKITTVSGKVIVIDPFLTQNPKTPAQFKSLDALGKVDLILVTHAHGDHIGDGRSSPRRRTRRSTRRRASTRLWSPSGCCRRISRRA